MWFCIFLCFLGRLKELQMLQTFKESMHVYVCLKFISHFYGQSFPFPFMLLFLTLYLFNDEIASMDWFFLIFEIPSVLSNENSPEKQNLDVEREKAGWVLRIWLLWVIWNSQYVRQVGDFGKSWYWKGAENITQNMLRWFSNYFELVVFKKPAQERLWKPGSSDTFVRDKNTYKGNRLFKDISLSKPGRGGWQISRNSSTEEARN